ncbi:hypothetical protein [Flavitalea sp.]|nr:hypothetical protein [Flavitalea sp.]
MKLSYNDIELSRMPSTGSYLTENSTSEGVDLELLYNREIFDLPTNPHASRIYKMNYNGRPLAWAPPVSVSRMTGLHFYFLSLLSHGISNRFFAIDDLSKRKRKFFKDQLEKLFHDDEHVLTTPQLSQFQAIADILSEDLALTAHDFAVSFTADNEIAIFRAGEDGTHYIVIGEEDDEVSYIYVSSTPGKYRSIHLDTEGKVTLNTITNAFVSE